MEKDSFVIEFGSINEIDLVTKIFSEFKAEFRYIKLNGLGMPRYLRWINEDRRFPYIEHVLHTVYGISVMVRVENFNNGVFGDSRIFFSTANENDHIKLLMFLS